ncbi:hypothetical protein BX286_1134 [Streptomyces sp. 3211.6]|uniref:hypothetical protein n=1 Tax=Streptomyces sp. 3211.6 TaxID=1938845 RepID=UPI000EAD5DA0|nr:hypothetical protein [Streptomyces sp. 3211.6]RKT03210.1 hypothetical protein BX286_1134 [Streptomyces sp. 3211.6]
MPQPAAPDAVPPDAAPQTVPSDAAPQTVPLEGAPQTGRAPAPPTASPLALELFVHGVAGAAPGELLRDPHPVRVTGDSTAAVFRRAEDADAEAHPGRYAGRPVPEAYCWSRLTSGNGARALWLLLLPFMVANLAHWARPATAPAGPQPRAVRAYGLLVRLLALALTVLLVAAACEVALDLLAWQCAGSRTCLGSRGPLSFLRPGGWWAQPGRRLALGALVPAALTGLLWFLSARTWSAYESQPPPAGTPGSAGTPGPAGHGDAPLGRPGFWYGRRIVARLRAAHTAAGLLTVAVAVAAPTVREDRRSATTPAGLLAAGWAVQALLAAGAATVLWVVCRRGRTEARPDHRLDRAAVTLLPSGALALLAAVLLHSGWSRPGWTSSGRLPGDFAFGVLMLGQGGCVLALALVARRLHRRAPTPGAALAGLGGPAAALLGCALGGVMSGGVAQRVADWLDGAATPGTPGDPLPGPPVLLSWQASVLPPLLLALALVAAAAGVRAAAARRRAAAGIAAEYPGAVPDPDRSRRIAGARAAAALTDTAPWFVGAVCLVTLLLGAGALTGAWVSGRVPAEAARDAHPLLAAAARAAQDSGSWLIGFGMAAFVALGRRAYRDPASRRTIGILWDVGTFWPRAAHPFAPPCYAERAVPDLTWRMTGWTARTGGRLVISGHSQGSVLAAAAVWQLPAETRRRVGLLTYGSPLARLYGRWFPAYFGPGPLAALHRDLDCWRNLWRATDPIGGPVGAGGSAGTGGPGRAGADAEGSVDRGPLADPVAYGRDPLHPLPAPILRHADYQADPAFTAERDALLARLAGLVRPGAPDGAALPAQRLSKAWAEPADPPGTAG